MKAQPQASVIIPTLNSAPALAIQLDSLLRQDYEGAFEILVIDNGSTDETRELLEDYYPRFAFRQVNLRYFISDRERNVCYARNVGIRYANSEKLLFCDADDMLSNNWVSQGIESLAERQVVSGSGIYFLEDTFKNFWALGKAYETIHPATETETYTPVNADRAIPILMGGSFAARRSALISRGFDVNAPWGSEDNELALHLREHGIETENFSGMRIAYRGRNPKAKSRRKAEFKSARAQVWLARKYRLTSQLPATRRGAWLLNPLRLPMVAAKMALVPSSRDWSALRSRFNTAAGAFVGVLSFYHPVPNREGLIGTGQEISLDTGAPLRLETTGNIHTPSRDTITPASGLSPVLVREPELQTTAG